MIKAEISDEGFRLPILDEPGGGGIDILAMKLEEDKKLIHKFPREFLNHVVLLCHNVSTVDV